MKNEKRLNLLLCCYIGVLLFSMVYGNYSIWQDELFTLNAIQGTYQQFMETIVADFVHPPLYYLLLKGWNDCLRVVGLNPIVAAKLFSIVLFVVAIVFGSKKILKEYGETAALYFVCFACMTQAIGYAVEIRMYSLSACCTLFAYLYAGDILRHETEKNWILFTVFSILAAYTHYFAVVSLSFVYFYLLYVGWKRKNVKPWVLCFGMTCIAYMPWLITMFMNRNHMQHDFYQPITIVHVGRFVILPFFNHNALLTVFVFALFMSITIGLTNKYGDAFTKVCCFNCLYDCIIGVVLSLTLHKFFNGKYLLPGFMVYLLGLAILVSRMKRQTYVKQIVCVLMVLCSMQYGIFEYKEMNGARQVLAILNDPEVKEVQAANKQLDEILTYYRNVFGIDDSRSGEANKKLVMIYSDFDTLDPSFNARLLNDGIYCGARISVYEIKE